MDARDERGHDDGPIIDLYPPMADFALYLVPALVFGAVATIVLVLGQQYGTWARISRRLPAMPQVEEIAADHPFPRLHAVITRRFDARRFGIDGPVRDKLRRELLQAGFFKGYRLVVEPAARVYDTPGSRAVEFQRKVRTLAGNYQIVRYYPQLISPAGSNLAAHRFPGPNF